VANALTDVGISGDGDAAAEAEVNPTVCCGYGTGGVRDDVKGAGDCLMIPGAIKAADDTPAPVTQCGNGLGLVTAAAAAAADGGKTVCTKEVPFRVRLKTDAYEYASDAMDEGGSTGNGIMPGFKLRYTQSAC